MRHFLLTSFASVLAASSHAAVLVIPDSIHDVSSFYSEQYRPENTINGSGLPGGYTTASSHAPYSNSSGGNHWTSAANTQPLDQFITFAFSTPKDLTAFHMWNHQSDGGIATNGGYDVTLFSLIFYAADGTTVLASLSNLIAAPDTNTAQTFNLGLVENVAYVRFEVEGVQGSGDYTGLAEVAFTAVPEPSAAILAALGVACLLRRQRR